MAWILFGVLAGGPPVAPAQEACSGSAEVELGAEEVALEYIAHASFRIHTGDGCRLLLDPYASRVWLGYDFPPGIGADAVVITHPHYDHDAGRFRELPEADSILGVEGRRVFDEPDTVRLGDARLVGVAGKHADPYGEEFGQRNTIWVVEVGGIRFAHLGDNGPLDEELARRLGRVDVLLVPVDGVEHILTWEAVERIRALLRPRIVVPMHYRIPELEPGDGPDDLGPVDPWLEGRERVRRLGTHRIVLSAGDLPEAPEVWVFSHAPAVVSPGEGR